MARFYVGQRVRIRCPGSEVDGQDTTIRRLDVEAEEPLDGKYVGAEVDIVGDGYPFCVFEYHELDPLTDPGREVVSWSECAWQPPHLREVKA